MQALPIPNFVAPATSLAISAITASAATIPVAENNYPPQRGIPTDDTTAKRLAAVQRDLRTAADALAQADRAPHGGFVEKALADVNQALADVDKGFDYLDSHPGENSTNAWGGNGRMPDPLRPLPNYAGGNLNGRGPRASRGFVPEGDSHLIAAYPALRAADRDMMTGPEVTPYQIGEIGGQREAIRRDLAQTVIDLVAALDFAHAAAHSPASPASDGELVINGGFEIPSAAAPSPQGVIRSPSASLSVGTSDGNEPAGFGWRVKSGSAFAPGGPIVIHQGFGNAFQGIHLDAPAYDGQQWLDLVGGGSGATPARPSRKSCPPPPAGSMFLPSPMRTTPSRPPRRAECLPQIPIRFPPPLASRTPRAAPI